MGKLIQQAITWLQLKELVNKLKLTDQEDKDLANAAVAMARKQYKESLSAHWEAEIEHRMKEERMIREISEMLEDVNNEKRDLV